MEEYKLLENLFLEKEKENLRLREEIKHIKEKEYKKDLPTLYKKESNSSKKHDNKFDTIRTMKNTQILMENNKHNLNKSPENTPYVKKLHFNSSLKKNLKTLEKNSPIPHLYNNTSIFSNSRNCLSLFNNDNNENMEFTNFNSNSTFNNESHGNTQLINNYFNQNNILPIDIEIEQYNKLKKFKEEKSNLVEKKLMNIKEREVINEEKKEVRTSNQFRGSYENFFNLEDNQIYTEFLDKNQLISNNMENSPHDKEIDLKKFENNEKIGNGSNLLHQEELNKFRVDFESKINDLIKKSENDKDLFQTKIACLEKDLQSKLKEKEKKLNKDENLNIQKNKEINDIQRQIENFKKRTFEELINSQKQNVKIYKKYQIYKDKFKKLTLEFENYKKSELQKEKLFRDKIANFKNLSEINEELKKNIEKTNDKIAQLECQVDELSKFKENHEKNIFTIERRDICNSSEIHIKKINRTQELNISLSNRSLNDSCSESVKNEKRKQEETINNLEKNLESLSKENIKLKYKVEQLENSSPHFQIKNIKNSLIEKNLSGKVNLLLRESKSPYTEEKKNKSLSSVKKPFNSISPLKSKDISAQPNFNQ